MIAVMNCHFHNVEILFLSAVVFNFFKKNDNSFGCSKHISMVLLSTSVQTVKYKHKLNLE